MMFLLVLLGCVSDAELSATVDEAACMWVDRCTDRYESVAQCVSENPSQVVPGCTVDTDAYGRCIELIDTSECPAGELFDAPSACDEVWVCDDAA